MTPHHLPRAARDGDRQRRARTVAYLRRRGISLDALSVAFPRFEADDVVFFCGSIPQGLANDDSDIDVLVIGDRPLSGGLLVEEGGGQLEYSVFHSGEVEVQIMRVPVDVAEQIARRLTQSLARFASPGADGRMTLVDDKISLFILSKIDASFVLHNEAGAVAWRQRLSIDRLPEYIAVIRLCEYFNLREDFLAEWRDGRPVSASWIAALANRLLAQATTAFHGFTEQNPKWTAKLLQQVEEIDPEVDSALFLQVSNTSLDFDEMALRRCVTFGDSQVRRLYRASAFVRRAVTLFNIAVKHRINLGDAPRQPAPTEVMAKD